VAILANPSYFDFKARCRLEGLGVAPFFRFARNVECTAEVRQNGGLSLVVQSPGS
jgi:hypothetical protein